MSNKTKGFYSSQKESIQLETPPLPLFRDLNGSEKSPLSLSPAENGVFLQKKLKKTKKVLDKPARMLYSFTVDKKQ
jgi:hypothetical protein